MMHNEVQPASMPQQVYQCRRLAQVLQMTREMLAKAEAGDWESVTEMELERRDDLARCFAEPIPLGDSELIAEALATLLHLNEELMSRLKTARTAVLEKSVQATNNRQAINSYESVGATLKSAS